MENATVKNLANLNGSVIKKAISINKTLIADDDKATVELVKQIGTVVNKMTEVINKYENSGTSLPIPVSGEATAIPTSVIADKIMEVMPKDWDVLKVVRNNGNVIVYLEPIMKPMADVNDIDTCVSIVNDAGMEHTSARVVDDGMAIALVLDTDKVGNPMLVNNCNADCPSCDKKETAFEYNECVRSDTPTRKQLLESITLVVARAVSTINRHIAKQNPTLRKLESAVGFISDLQFFVNNKLHEGTNEYKQAQNLYNTILTIKGMLDNHNFDYIEQVPAYKA